MRQCLSAGCRSLFFSSTSHWMIQLPSSWWRGPSSELRPQFKCCGTRYAMLWSTAFEWSSVLSSLVTRWLAHVLWDSCVLGCNTCWEFTRESNDFPVKVAAAHQKHIDVWKANSSCTAARLVDFWFNEPWRCLRPLHFNPMLMSTTRRCGNSTCSEHVVIYDVEGVLLIRFSLSRHSSIHRRRWNGLGWMRGKLPITTGGFLRGRQDDENSTSYRHTPRRFGLIQQTQGLRGRKVWESYIRPHLSCKTPWDRTHGIVNLCERIAPFKVEEDLLFAPDFLALFRSAP